MVDAHPRPQFLVDERVFMVLKYTETANFWKQSGVKGSFRFKRYRADRQ